MRCRRCHVPFTVDFPFPERIKRSEKNETLLPHEMRDQNPFSEINRGPGADMNIRKEGKPKKPPLISKKVISDNGKDKQAKIITPSGGKIFTGYTLRELLVVCGPAFSFPELVVASVGVIIAFFMYTFSESFQRVIFDQFFPSMPVMVRSFLNLFPFALILFIFIQTSALISRMFQERIFYNREPGAGRLTGFIGRTWLPAFLGNFFIIAAVNTLITLFGNVPFVSPLLFSLILLPLYLLSLLVIITLFFGFWFYPPIIAAGNTGMINTIRNFRDFLKKHKFTLPVIVPVLIMTVSIIYAVLSLLHTGALSLSLLIMDGTGSELVAGLPGSVPPFLLRVSEFSLFGNGAGRFKELVSGLVFSQHVGGFIIGMVLASVSVLLAASFISLVSTLSTHVYIHMERGVNIDDRKMLRLLGTLVLLLAGMVLVKKMFLLQ